MRLGYRIACDRGARYIATLDADGQWDPADLPQMVALVEADRADVVVGSRQMRGMQDTKEFRDEHVRLFAWVTSKLTRTRLTDASSGLRLMRAEVTAAVPQTQPQYHSLEFLIGALFQGFRVAEVPITMRHRTSGTSRKGGAVVRMLRYAQVIARVWWRKRRPTPPISSKLYHKAAPSFASPQRSPVRGSSACFRPPDSPSQCGLLTKILIAAKNIILNRKR